MQPDIAALAAAMVEYDRGDPRRIQHFLKVHSLAALIGTLEGLDPAARRTLEAAALVHDIGIHNSEAKYHDCTGPHQELEGPPEATALLRRLGWDAPAIDRVAWLVGHHHTYHPVGGPDHQILLEADLLVNLYEDAAPPSAAAAARERVFRTGAGTRLLADMFGLDG